MAQPTEAGPEIAAALHPIRWPIPTEADALADGLLSGALGLFAALLVFGTLRLFLRPSRSISGPIDSLAASRDLPAADRLVALARIATSLPESAPLRQTLSTALYRPDPGLDLDDLERELGAALKRGST